MAAPIRRELQKLCHACQLLLAAVAVCGSVSLSYADSVFWSGSISQSPSDASQTAVNNPTLNSIFDFQAFSVTLDFNGSILAPGTYKNLIGATLTFTDGSAGAIETAFDTIFLTITANGGLDDFSLLGCLTTGSFGCFGGNQLDANFEIPAAGLNSQGVTATGLDQPHPLDLLEDDGATEVQGTITGYSYTAAAPVPEPSSLGLSSLGALLVVSGHVLVRKSNSRSQ